MTIENALISAVGIERAAAAGLQAVYWPEARGGGFLIWGNGISMLVNCSDERWCVAWGKFATVRDLDEMDRMIEVMIGRVDKADQAENVLRQPRFPRG